jgi:hypothetical protein
MSRNVSLLVGEGDRRQLGEGMEAGVHRQHIVDGVPRRYSLLEIVGA